MFLSQVGATFSGYWFIVLSAICSMLVSPYALNMSCLRPGKSESELLAKASSSAQGNHDDDDSSKVHDDETVDDEASLERKAKTALDKMEGEDEFEKVCSVFQNVLQYAAI